MSQSNTSNWQFSRKVMVPIVIAILVTIGTVAGFVTWSIGRTDEHALARQTTLLQQALADKVAAIPVGQMDLAVWDEALTAIEDRDLQWLNENIGGSAFDSYGQGRVYLLDANGKPIYAMRDGGQVPAKAFETVREAITPLIEELHSLDNLAAIDAYNNFIGDAPPATTDMVLLEDRPAIVSVMPMLHNVSTDFAPVGEEPVYVAVLMLDGGMAGALQNQFLFEKARFDTNPDIAGSEARFPISNKGGETIAWFKWQPDRPGARILNDTLPALLGALFVAGAIIVVLMRNLQRASSQLQAERADAQHRAMHDPLTGLGNRALFRDRLDSALRTLPRGEPRLALLALDLDRFKQVNDTLGHEAGDELLRQVAARITSILRPSDTLVRLGGDEFAVLQTGIATHGDAAGLAQRIIDSLQAPFHLAGKVAEIGVSIGIATVPDLAQTDGELVTRADDALYHAKSGGRNRYCFHANAELLAGHPTQLEQQVRQAFAERGAA
ncbi:diguanylate cyclase [Devosia sp. Root436]|uniref:diguanylate cyclase domain-containing protein n=1 Tax=Devosia sp. Root436 TaxID=1736537 RepID=UPI0009EC99BB|nr:diguanylate cyclase [Devosia sp. Root436]